MDEYIVLCIHTINKQTEATSLQQTRIQYLNPNIPNHSHWKIHPVKQYPFTLSTNIKTIPLTLLSIHTQEENLFYGKAVRKRCVFSLNFKDDRDERRRILNGSEFQTSGAWYRKDRALALFRLTLRTVRRFWMEESGDLEDEYEDRQQEG